MEENAAEIVSRETLEVRRSIHESTVIAGSQLPTNESAKAAKRRRARGKSVEERREQQILALRKRAFNYVLISSSATLLLILIIMLLQGFHLWGFDLPGQLLYTLLAATVAKVAESLYIVMRFLFRG